MKKTLITFFIVLFCLTSSVSWSLEYKDLVKRDGIFYKKFSDVPFSGKVEGKYQVTFKSGKKEGLFLRYWDNGQLHLKGFYQNGKKINLWITYHANGNISTKGNYKNGKREGNWIELDTLGNVTNHNSRISRINGINVFTSGSGSYKNGIRVNTNGDPINAFDSSSKK